MQQAWIKAEDRGSRESFWNGTGGMGLEAGLQRLHYLISDHENNSIQRFYTTFGENWQEFVTATQITKQTKK